MPPPRTVDPATRRRIEHELLHPADPPRSRAAIAREHGVNPRTVSRYAAQLGLDSGAVFDTAQIRAATISATDRRRALRSDIADRLLRVEAERILDRLAASDTWTRAVAVGEGGGMQAVRVIVEDDATIARGIKDLHAALAVLLGKTLDIDKADAQPDDTSADDTLGRLFDGLGAAYQLITGHPVDHPAEEVPDA